MKPCAAILFTLALLLAGAGCEVAGVMAHAIGGGPERPVRVKAEYRGLENASVAILVASRDELRFKHPAAARRVAEAVGRRLVSDVPGMTIVDPDTTLAWQRENPWWMVERYDTLLETFEVDRLLIIDLIDYTMHDGTSEQRWRGRISARVQVAEAESSDPNQLAYAENFTARFPAEGGAGLLDTTDRAVELGMLDAFSRMLSAHFADHTRQGGAE